MAAPPSSERPRARRAGFPWGTLLVVAFFAALNGAGIAWIRHGLRPPRGAFRVRSFEPAGETPQVRPAVTVAFNLPVLATKDPPSREGWIRLDPPVRGRSVWLTPSTLAFYPERDLERGREYRAFLSSALRGAGPGCPPEGLPLEGAKEFRFSIEPLRLLRAEQVGLTNRSEASLLLVFNGEMPSGGFERISLKDAQGGDVPHQVENTQVRGQETFVWVKCRTESPSVEVVFGPPPKGDPRAPKGGGAGSGARPPAEAAFVVPLVREFGVVSVRAEPHPGGAFSIWVGFTHPLDPAQTGAQGGGGDLSPFFEIQPPVAFAASALGSEVRLRGEFRRRVRYAVTVKKGIRGDGAGELTRDFSDHVLLPELSPSVTFPGQGSRLSALGNLSVALEVANAEDLTIQAHRVLENNLVHFLSYRRSLDHFARPIGSKTYRLARNPERTEEVVVDLRDIVGPEPKGLWYLEAFIPGDRAGRLVSVSDLALTLKLGRRGARAPGEALAWVTSLRSGEPIPGAAVSLWSRNNQRIAEAQSDADGIARFEALPDSPDGPPAIATASKDGDLGYLEIDEGRLSRTDFDVQGRPPFREGHEAFVYTERRVYRPGDTVHARAIVASAEDLAERPPRRVADETPAGRVGAEGDLGAALPDAASLEAALLALAAWSDRKVPPGPELAGDAGAVAAAPLSDSAPPGPGDVAEGAVPAASPAVLPSEAEGEAEEAARLAGMPLEWEVLRPDGKRFRLERCVLGRSSAAELALPVPLTAGTGRYEIRLRLPGGGPGSEVGRTTFLVEEYMPNRIRAHLRLAGERARFRPKETVPFVVEARYLFGLPAEGSPVKADWRLRATRFAPEGWSGFQFGPLANADAAAAVGSSESAVGPDGLALFSVDLPVVETASPLRLEVSAAVADAGGRAVTAETSAPVDPTPFYLGLRALDSSISIERPARFACVAVDPAGKPFALEAAELVAKRVQRDWIHRLGPGGSYSYEKVERVEEVERRRIGLSGGRGELEIAFGSLGLHRIELRDPASGAKAELEVWVSGPEIANLPSPVAHPERVEIVPSKPSCAPGTKVQLQIRLPFPGAVLVSTELDRVEWAKAFRAEGRSLDVEVPVPETWADGNFYVAATVVRGIDPEAAEPVAPRAWGLVSVPLDLSERKLHLTVSSPEEVRPGSLGRIRVVASAEDGAPIRGAEVSVALVDEGILSLASYRTPDPFAHFFPKRAHAVDASDLFGDLLAEVPLARARSRPGGDQGLEEESAPAARLLSPILGRRVEPAVRWLGPAPTAADGSALLEFDAPRTTGQLRVIAVANEKTRRFGSAEGSIIVRSPFFFELGLPRFLAPGDRVVAPVRLFNQTPRAGRAMVEWTLSLPGGESGREIAEAAPAEGSLAYAAFGDAAVEVPAGGSETVAARLAAPEEPGLARASVRATLVPGGAEPVVPAVASDRPSAAEETYAETVEIPVRPPSPAIALGRCGRVSEGSPLEIRPALAKTLAARYRLVVSRFPEVELANAIRYLVHYPYGCLEQTTSSAFPLVYLRDLIERTGIEPPPCEERDGRAADASLEDRRRRLSEDVDRFVLAGIQRILDMQSPAGWCSMWPGSSWPWTWGSIYAAHFLIEARAAGYPVPSAELDALLEYVGSRVRSDENEGETGALERAYGLYVLALAEKPDLGTLDALSAAIAAQESAAARAGGDSPDPSETSAGVECPSARYLLAAAWYRAGRAERAKALLGSAIPEPSDVRDTGGALRSPARETAFLLSALLDVDPRSPLVDPLVERLRSYREDGRWGTTQENAFAVLALGKYARVLARDLRGATAEVRIGDAEPIAIRPDADDRASWTFEGGCPPEEIRVSVSGPGTLFYSWTEDGVPLEPPDGPVDLGIEVRRRYLDASGAPLDLANVRAGETVLVEISLRSDRYIANVAVVDLLPAGLEVENPRLDGKSERVARLIESARKSAREDEDLAVLEPAAMSHRDDRVVAFVDLPSGPRRVFYHVSRAVTRGEFRVPPVRAEALYDPRISGLSGAGRMAVR